jgi:hypothetical protein
MRLDRETRKRICGTIFRRYQKAGKKGKATIPEEYTQTLGYNRDYLAHLPTNWGKTRYALSNGKPVKYAAKPPVKGRCKACGGKERGRPGKHHQAFVEALTETGEFFDFQCGKLLAALVTGTVDFLALEFALGDEICVLFKTASPAAIDRKLRKEKERFRIKGIRAAKPGSLLNSQIPLRVCVDRNGRRPGFFELDTVSHCGARASGQFCQALTVTDVGSCWTELCALLNNARRWAKERIAHTRETLPFPMLGIDSDNGGEFISHQVLDWRIRHTIKSTRSRPYRTNGNCFVEQKTAMWCEKPSDMRALKAETPSARLLRRTAS